MLLRLETEHVNHNLESTNNGSCVFIACKFYCNGSSVHVYVRQHDSEVVSTHSVVVGSNHRLNFRAFFSALCTY